MAELWISGVTWGRTDGSNWIALTLSGTSTQSVYGVEWTTNVAGASWLPAEVSGTSIPGQDWETSWTDWGGPSRDVNVLSNLFYRALLK